MVDTVPGLEACEISSSPRRQATLPAWMCMARCPLEGLQIPSMGNVMKMFGNRIEITDMQPSTLVQKRSLTSAACVSESYSMYHGCERDSVGLVNPFPPKQIYLNDIRSRVLTAT